MTWAPPRWGVALGWGAGGAAWTEAEVSVGKATNDARYSREQTVSKFEGRELTRDSRGFGLKTQDEPSLGGRKRILAHFGANSSPEPPSEARSEAPSEAPSEALPEALQEGSQKRLRILEVDPSALEEI